MINALHFYLVDQRPDLDIFTYHVSKFFIFF